MGARSTPSVRRRSIQPITGGVCSVSLFLYLFKYDCLACTDNGTDANVDIPAQACHHACSCGFGTSCSPLIAHGGVGDGE